MYNTRFHRILPPEALDDFSVVVAGVGAVGSHLAYGLSKMGAKIKIFDPDTVGEENLGTQMYGKLCVGMPKVVAMLKTLRFLGAVHQFSEGLPREMNERNFWVSYPREPNYGLVLCVDSMKSREKILNERLKRGKRVSSYLRFIVDIRVGGEVVQVLSLKGEELRDRSMKDWLLSTIVPDEEARNEPCGATMFIPTAMAAAALGCCTVKAGILGLPSPRILTVDLRNWFTVGLEGIPGVPPVGEYPEGYEETP